MRSCNVGGSGWGDSCEELTFWPLSDALSSFSYSLLSHQSLGGGRDGGGPGGPPGGVRVGGGPGGRGRATGGGARAGGVVRGPLEGGLDRGTEEEVGGEGACTSG